MNVFLQILKVNELRKGIGKVSKEPYEMQDAECIILSDTGEVAEVGVLLIPKDLMGTIQPGTFAGSFAMRANKGKEGGRKIEAVLTGLRPVTRSDRGFVQAEPPKPAKG